MRRRILREIAAILLVMVGVIVLYEVVDRMIRAMA